MKQRDQFLLLHSLRSMEEAASRYRFSKVVLTTFADMVEMTPAEIDKELGDRFSRMKAAHKRVEESDKAAAVEAFKKEERQKAKAVLRAEFNAWKKEHGK